MDERKMAFAVEELLAYGLQRGLIQPEDVYFCRNQLLDILQLEEPWEETENGQPCAAAAASAQEKCPPDTVTPEPILRELLDGCAEKGLLPENLTTYRDMMDARIMGELTPRPSEVAREFYRLRADAPEKASEYFYALSRSNHYIMQERIDRNLYWQAPTAYGDLEITINLSKPEKDPREIAKLREMKSASYPKCLLCPENVGYAGRPNHPARQNLRQIPVTLQGESWYLQYSPYVYYQEHCILLKGEHVPMKISPVTFRRLLYFVDLMPHYFMGSNAGLPVVGGSSLHHEHYQGGRHVFPMEKAATERRYCHPDFPGIRVRTLRWPLSTIRISGADREELAALADRILAAWEAYSAPELSIFAETEENGKRTPHNAITPIARINRDGEYELDLALRNNLTTPELPDGIFHPHPRYHHIKKENIGLIEVMGLAVLPGRLQKELEWIREILGGRPEAELTPEQTEALEKHRPWMERLKAEHGTAMKEEEARALLHQEVGEIFAQVLRCCGVFKEDAPGRKAFDEFMTGLGMEALPEQ